MPVVAVPLGEFQRFIEHDGRSVQFVVLLQRVAQVRERDHQPWIGGVGGGSPPRPDTKPQPDPRRQRKCAIRPRPCRQVPTPTSSPRSAVDGTSLVLCGSGVSRSHPVSSHSIQSPKARGHADCPGRFPAFASPCVSHRCDSGTAPRMNQNQAKKHAKPKSQRIGSFTIAHSSMSRTFSFSTSPR